MLRVEGGLRFANAVYLRERIGAAAREPGIRAVVLDAETMPFVDVSAFRMLDELRGDLARRGHVRDVLRRAGAAGDLTSTQVYPGVPAAVAAAARGRRSPRSEPRAVTAR